MSLVAFCLGFKDWYPDHLDRCLRTIRAGAPTAPIVVCDLGSADGLMPTVRATVASVAGHLVSVEEREWSRSRALNLAAAAAPATPWYVFTDADMLFPASWFHALARHLTEDVFADRFWLSRSRDLSELDTDNLAAPLTEDWLIQHTIPHPPIGQGGAMVIPAKWFRSVGGFDEFYQVWGAEDNDLVQRAQWDGQSVQWLTQESGDWAWVAHQWHRRDWPTTAQFDQVKRNRAYLAERMVAKGPIIRNRA